jgi:hypothetical protein
MSRTKKSYYRLVSLICIVVLVVASLIPFLSGKKAYAYGLVTSRSIQMSDSTASDTGVTYGVSFTPSGSATIQGIDVDFCLSDPIIGDSCTSPVTDGFSLGTPTVSGQSSNISTFTTAATINTGRTLELTAGSATSVSGAVTFNITTVTNINVANTTFYARILTFDTAAHAAAYTDTGANTGLTDAGGIAMSTAQAITVTGKVQEQLSFCVGTHATGSGSSATAQTSCGSLSSTGVTLGNTNGVLSSSGVFTDVTTQYIVGTNASGGAIINLKGATLTSGSNTITAIGSSAAASNPGSSQFGLCNYEGTGTNLAFTGYNTYNNGSCHLATQTAGYGSTGGDGGASYGFNTTNTTSTYGDTIAKESAGSNSTGIIPMIANINTAQIAGIYTTTLTFIATGTY